MDELRKEYILLFNGITDTIRQLESTINRLKMMQSRAEEVYLLEGECKAECAEAAPEHETREEAGVVSPQ